ncbi:penicillin-binding protein 2 [Paraburkholderia fungorum]|uniref:peptidoglycan D,D-transpeptidase FtsI family protein n=1 Tax=Paraburkholderia TaxID=1822464 RepID=UPI0038B74925
MRQHITFNQTPILKADASRHRSTIVMILMSVAFASCAVRALWIQVIDNKFYQKEGASRVEHVIDVHSERGKILDRNGMLLATNVPVRSVWADPKAIPDDLEPGKLAMLGRLLDMPEQQINAQIDSDKTFVYLKHQVPLGIAGEIKALDIPGIYQIPEYKRLYPEGEVAAQLVGFGGIAGGGEDGVELAQDVKLKSVDGTRLAIRDRVGHVVEYLGDITEPHPGTDIQLALNGSIQYSAFNALRSAVTSSNAESGSAIVVDGHTGEVLALANYPSYDPNDRSALRGPALRNRAVTDVFEPGSIMKPFTVSLALDLRRLMPDSLVETNRTFSLDGATITDDANFGTLTVAGVIQKSSNIGATKIALTMKPEEMWNMYTALGYGQSPDLGFPGAGVGIVRPWRKWHRIDQATMSYGYGVSVSLVQLAHAYTVFANNGRLVPLSLYKTDEASITGTQIFTQRTSDEVRAMLESVVAKGGTAPQAQVPGYSVGGKTGTAYTAARHGYERNTYRASFVGIIPIRNPRLVIAVSVDKPKGARHYGGDVSGPVFAEIAQAAMRALDVEPDEPIVGTAKTLR